MINLSNYKKLGRNKRLETGDVYQLREDHIVIPESWVGKTPDTCHTRLYFAGDFYRKIVKSEYPGITLCMGKPKIITPEEYELSRN